MKQSGILQNNLVVLRAEKRWSQTDLANKAGVSRQTIASIEANRYNPSLILAFEIAHILGKEFHEVFQYKINNYFEVIKNCILALTIKENKKTYINETFCFDNTIDDLLSISYYNLGLYDISLYYVDRALKYDKNNKRLLKNRDIIMEKNNKE